MKINCFTGKRNAAFTLAEVLITLAIIGIVAALTIPSVVKNYQKTQTITKLKKEYSTINQAYNVSQAENGMYQTWDNAEDMEAEEYFNKYWKPYLKVSKICTTHSDCGYETNTPWTNLIGESTSTSAVAPTARTTFLTPDGVLFVIFTKGGTEGAPINDIYVDLNASKKPNVTGKDLFYFKRTDKGILPNCYGQSIGYINIYCSKTGSGSCCTAKLMYEGWEMKNNYPW
jgi:prepilin-type N-terminal cleavage/methylation domain-containing protein